MKRVLFLGVILAVAAAVSFLVTTKPYRVGVGGSRLEPSSDFSQSCFLCRYLGLSEEQKLKINNLDKSLSIRKEKICNHLDNKRVALSQLLLQPDLSHHNIDSKVDEISVLQGKLNKEIMRHILEIKAILTPLQQNKFLSFIAEEFCRIDIEER